MEKTEYSKDLAEFIERFKNATDLLDDYGIYLECRKQIENFNRQTALCLLQKIISKYKVEINQLGCIEGGIHIVYNINYDGVKDDYIKNQLSYLGARIPMYVLIREDNKHLIKELENRIDEFWNGLI